MTAPETPAAAETGTPAAAENNAPPCAAIQLHDIRDVVEIVDAAKDLVRRIASAEFVLIDQTGSYLLGVLRFDPADDAVVYDPRRYGEEA